MRKIEWSLKAEYDYLDNIDFLQHKWTINEVHNFIDKVEEVIGLLQKENVNFKPTDYKNTYQITITKQITLYYCINQNNDIELLRFFNNYQNPERLSL